MEYCLGLLKTKLKLSFFCLCFLCCSKPSSCSVGEIKKYEHHSLCSQLFCNNWKQWIVISIVLLHSAASYHALWGIGSLSLLKLRSLVLSCMVLYGLVIILYVPTIYYFRSCFLMFTHILFPYPMVRPCECSVWSSFSSWFGALSVLAVLPYRLEAPLSDYCLLS